MSNTIFFLSTNVASWKEQIQDIYDKAESNLHLSVKPPLKTKELAQLKSVFEQLPQITKLSLEVDLNALKDPLFLEALEQLNQHTLSRVELIFATTELKKYAKAITEVLTKTIAPKVAYVLQIRQFTEQGPQTTKLKLETFQNQVIANIQERYKTTTLPGFKTTPPAMSNESSSKKIKLKALINKKQQIKPDVPIEVQHVETTEQQIAAQHQELVENVQIAEVKAYEGQLINFDDFSSPLYKNKVKESTGDEALTESLYTVLRNELFANLPHAIKFVSPDAASQLATNLGALVSLNKDNLPHGFHLKKTAVGEYVLDYDEYQDNPQVNEFTPSHKALEAAPLYAIELKEAKVKEWLDNDSLFNLLIPKNKPYTTTTQLINLWIKYGDEGLATFFSEFKKNTAASPGLAEFLMTHYMIPLPQWDHLHNNTAFFDSLSRISHYDEPKQQCLKTFLEKTGSSCHDLNKTLGAFETFWQEVSQRCKEQNVPVARINQVEWTTPEGGNPAVYMERLLQILKNARHLEDQFQGLHELQLGNFEAYYASRYEGYTSVSKEMQLDYDYEKEDQEPFNPHCKLYRADFQNYIKEYADAEMFSRFREHLYIRQQRAADPEKTAACDAKREERKTDRSWERGLEDVLSEMRYHLTLEIPADNTTDEEKISEYWLINCENELPTPTTLGHLKSLGLVKPLDLGSFKAPYKIYSSLPDGSLKLLFDKLPHRYNRYGKQFDYAMGYRHIGTQNHGIRVAEMRYELESMFGVFVGKGHEDALAVPFLTALFFVSHERYLPSTPVKELIKQLYYAKSDYQALASSIHLLGKLYALDIKLNQAEGLVLFSSLASMNSSEFEAHGFDKMESVDKLLRHLEENKYATFKYFNYCSGSRWPFVYALDTAEVLAEDPMIDFVYHDDLLLFSGLIYSDYKEMYHHNRFKTPDSKNTQEAKQALANLEGVRHYLHQAAILDKPNNLQYAIQTLLYAKKSFRYDQFLKSCKEIEALPSFDNQKINAILEQYGFTIQAASPDLTVKDSADLKNLMCQLILRLDQHRKAPPSNAEVRKKELASLTIAQLQLELQESWSEAGALLSIADKLFLRHTLHTYKDIAIKQAFGLPEARGILKAVGEKVKDFIDFKKVEDFEQVNHIVGSANKLAQMVQNLIANPYVKENEQDLIGLFYDLDFSVMDYESLFSVLHTLSDMPQRNYLPLLSMCFAEKQFMSNKARVIAWADNLSTLNHNLFPTDYLRSFSQLMTANPQQNDFSKVMNAMVVIYEKDNKDPVLEFLMTESQLSYNTIEQILELSQQVENNRDKVKSLLLHLNQQKSLELTLNHLSPCDPKTKKAILDILSQGQALSRKQQAIPYDELATLLVGLSPEELDILHEFYQTTPVSAECLFNALKQPHRNKNFKVFIQQFEKAPFGERDLAQQFSTAEVERVVNYSKDLLNDSIYTRQYRKQWMEAFLFVNQIGESVPVYYNKAAKDLSNEEIKTFFAHLKDKKIPGLTPFQNRLLALGLMRETMYRSTGEFPYSTQMLALIDGMMHQGDFISNIDTGQGKSLIDLMKATLLWLDSDRVDLTTSSLVDAKRDIGNYGPFLKLLGVPYSEKPISSGSSLDAFKKDGINFSTAAQLSLFYSKARAMGYALDSKKSVVSLVVNESDYALLDDRVIYRFATAEGAQLAPGQEWIYTAINEFVTRPAFLSDENTTAKEDIQSLKAFLRAKANALKKPLKLVNKFNDEVYLSWIDSALTANFILEENKDYVVPEEFEKKIINGKEVNTRVAKVLMQDGKVSPDSSFGNGIHQFLYARLNKQTNRQDFVIEPENKTILSTNNKNLIDYYRAHKGFIWGSSGTVGSPAEILEQYKKYGFEFSKIEPHQKNRVQYNKPLIERDEEAQFKKLVSLLTLNNPDKKESPHVVFFKDIDTATRFYQYLEQNNPNQCPIQLYTGLGKEEDYIKQASQSSMITLSTSAIGRNTDIHYDRIKGLRVWHACPDSVRAMGQKSGRTGRQGSAGEVNMLLNGQDLNGLSLEKIQVQLDNFAASERAVNEDYYDLLGYLFIQMDRQANEHFIQGKAIFLRDQWSKFSADTEKRYRDNRQNGIINKEQFNQETLASFNQLMQTALKTPMPAVSKEELSAALSKQQSARKAYRVDTNPVSLKECTPPMTIAYHLLQLNMEDKEPEKTKAVIKARLEQLFKEITSKNWMAKNKDYLAYLTATPSTQTVIAEAHREFLKDYLHQEQPQNFGTKLWLHVKRWLGFESKLNQIADNPNYLLMFHAFANLPNKTGADLDLIKKSVNSLLDQYLDNWFINKQRETWVLALKTHINRTQDVDEVIKLLSQSQVQVAQQDIQTNTQRFFKPLHVSGKSRYQTALSRALNLTTALSGKTQTESLINELAPLLSETTDKSPLTEVTHDELKHRARGPKADRANASVIRYSLEKAVEIKHRDGPKSMLDRASSLKVKEENQGLDENTSPGSKKP